MHKLLFAALCLAVSASVASAQPGAAGAFPKVEWFVGSSGNHTYYEDSPSDVVPATLASLFTERAQGLGVETSLTANLNPWLGLAGDFSIFFRRLQGDDGVFHVQSKALFLMAGPEFKARRRARMTPIARALFGVARSSAVFTYDVPGIVYADSNARTGLAMALGGGVDVHVAPRWSVRGTFDYMKTVLGDVDPEEGGWQTHNRITLGVVIRAR